MPLGVANLHGVAGLYGTADGVGEQLVVAVVARDLLAVGEGVDRCVRRRGGHGDQGAGGEVRQGVVRPPLDLAVVRVLHAAVVVGVVVRILRCARPRAGGAGGGVFVLPAQLGERVRKIRIARRVGGPDVVPVRRPLALLALDGGDVPGPGRGRRRRRARGERRRGAPLRTTAQGSRRQRPVPAAAGRRGKRGPLRMAAKRGKGHDREGLARRAVHWTS